MRNSITLYLQSHILVPFCRGMPNRTVKAKGGSKSQTKKVSRGSRGSPASQRKSMTVSDIRSRFKTLDESVRKIFASGTLKGLGQQISRLWTSLFNKPLSAKSGESLAQHFSMLYGKSRTVTKGGSMLEGAPIGAEMRPGLPEVVAYATFPTEVGADPKAVQDMDVYYNSAIGRSCGTENTSAIPWSGIGSNLVPMTSVGYQSRGGNRRRSQKAKRSTKGGNFLTAMNSRLYVATNPSNPMMRGSEMWAGKPFNAHDSADPSDHAWTMQYGSDMAPPAPADNNGSPTLASAPAFQPALSA